jgi:dienelactone hydrolase
VRWADRGARRLSARRRARKVALVRVGNQRRHERADRPADSSARSSHCPYESNVSHSRYDVGGHRPRVRAKGVFVGFVAAAIAGCRSPAPDAQPDDRAATTTTAAPRTSAPAPGPTLTERRKGFVTRLTPRPLQRDPIPPEAPAHSYERVQFTSPIGKLRAYVTPDPGDGRRHAAVLDCHGGFGGVGAWLWEPPDYTKPFRDAGLVYMVPSWRGENDNPGDYEMFWGEIDDAGAALAYLRNLPYVDPARVYVIGHSTGGTVALLLSTETDGARAIFSLEGAPDVRRWIAHGGGPGFVPFDQSDLREWALRSAITMISSVRVPTWWFYAEHGGFATDAPPLRRASRNRPDGVSVVSIAGADHGSILIRLTPWLAQRIAADVDVSRPFPPLAPDEAQRAFDIAR